MQYPWPEVPRLTPSPASCITNYQSPSVPSVIQQEKSGFNYSLKLSEMLVAFNADVPIHFDDTMLSNHNLHETTITSSNFEQGLLLPDCKHLPEYQCWHDHSLERYKHANDDGDACMECLPDMWESWLTQLQPLNDEAFDASAAACTSILPNNFSSEMSPNSLLDISTSIPAAAATSFVHSSPISFDASSYVANQHDNLHNLYINNHSKEHLDINVNILSKGDRPRHQLNVVARGSPSLPNLEARPAQPIPKLETKASTEASGARRNHSKCSAIEGEEAVKFVVETSTPNIDDGFVWRKYGQKWIKDKIHPRGYFKCAQRNCPVKKHTESSSDRQGIIIITYFGRHNHETLHSSLY